MDLKKYIRSIPDYPKKGILFRDITTLIKNPKAFNFAIDKIVEISKKIEFDKIADAFGLKYKLLKSNEEMETQIPRILSNKRPYLIEVVCSTNQEIHSPYLKELAMEDYEY